MKRFRLPVIIGVVVAWLAVGSLWLKAQVAELVPLNPTKPYLLTRTEYLPSVGWQWGLFQPVYLWSYEKDGGLYYKVSYRNSGGKVGFLDVFVGGTINGKNMPMVQFDEGKDSAPAGTNGEIYKKIFQRGDRLVLRYFVSTDVKHPEGKNEICARNPRLCMVEELVTKDENEDVKTVRVGGGIFGRKLIHVISISTNLENLQ